MPLISAQLGVSSAARFLDLSGLSGITESSDV
jgi:hypothetical protein